MLKDRTCTRCGAEYNPDSPSQRYCLACRPIAYEEMRQARYEKWRRLIERARENDRKKRREEYFSHENHEFG